MWKNYPAHKRTPEEWLKELSVHKASAGYKLNRILRMMYRERLIGRDEQKRLWQMISSTEEDQMVALLVIENKYKPLKTEDE
jgi:hypothetical protein